MFAKTLTALFIFAITGYANEHVSNPAIESIELRGDYSNIGAEGIQDNEIRLNFNGDKASQVLKDSYNTYLDLESKQMRNDTELESSKLQIKLTSLNKLISQSKKDLAKIKLINLRDVNSKYKERRLRDELNLLKDEYQFLVELLKIKRIENKSSQLSLPEIKKVKMLSYRNSLSYKLLTHEGTILKEQENIRNGMKFVSVTNNMDREVGIKFGYAFQFGEGAQESFKRIRERREIKKTLREYEVDFFTIKHNLVKSIKKYENAQKALKRANRKVKNTRDKTLVLNELFNLHKLRREAYSEKISLMEYLSELQSYWGEVI